VGDEMAELIKKTILEYNVDGNKASLTYIGNDFVIAVCSSFMQRVHTLLSAGQICFLDSSGNVGRFNGRVFLPMIDSVAGGLPVGAFITTSESEAVITAALEEYKKLLPDVAFGGNEKRGPAVFMADNNVMCNSLSASFSESTCLLSTFLVLQATWRWLWDVNHSIEVKDQEECFSLIYQMLHCATETEIDEAFNKASQSAVAECYPNFQQYVSDLYVDRYSWALCCRQELLMMENNTSNMVESTFHVLKDNVFSRTRAYSVPQLFGFVTDSLDKYFSNNLIATVRNKKHGQRSFYVPSSRSLKDIDMFVISRGVTSGLYTVFNISTGETCFTHLTIGICSCTDGINGGPCIHQYAVTTRYHLESHTIEPMSAETKTYLTWVATGSCEIPHCWRRPRNCMSRPKKSRPRIDVNNIAPSTSAVSSGDELIGDTDCDSKQDD